MTVLKVSCIFLEFIFVYVFVKGIDFISFFIFYLFLYLKFHIMINYMKHTFVPKIIDKLFLLLLLALSQLTLILLLLFLSSIQCTNEL
jgi:hypothetical protein